MSWVAIVTGANRGIGTAICQGLIKSRSNGPSAIYACSRSGNDLGLDHRSKDGNDQAVTIHYPKLDITRHDEVQDLVDRVRLDHGGLNLLVNNAGVSLDQQYNIETVKQTLDTNYRGTLSMCQSFLPLLRTRQPNARIVNLSSLSSALTHYSPAIKEQFRRAKSLRDVEQLAESYMKAVQTRLDAPPGWGRRQLAYVVSKSLINSLTTALADEPENQGVLINACCPGWVSSDMGKRIGPAPKSPAEGAKIPLHLALDDIDSLTGKYWANDSYSDTTRLGRVQDWLAT